MARARNTRGPENPATPGWTDGHTKALGDALNAVRVADVARLLRELRESIRTDLESLTKDYPLQCLALLQRKLKHREVRVLYETIEAVCRERGSEPSERIIRTHIQSLIDQGSFRDATEAIDKHFSNGEKSAQVLALEARIAKQGYIDEDGAKPQLLEHAIELYSAAFEVDRTDHYPLINVAVLKARAEADAVTVPTACSSTSARDDALDVLAIVANADDKDIWAAASTMEASILLGDYDAADTALDRYRAHAGQSDGADAFEYNSTLRQLTEVLRFDSAEPDQGRFLEPLRNTLSQLSGGVVEAAPLAADGRYTDVARTTAERSVAILKSDNGVEWAGVLVAGTDLDLASEIVLVTTDDEFNRSRDVTVTAAVAGAELEVGPQALWHESKYQLDFICLSILAPLPEGVGTVPAPTEALLPDSEIRAISFTDGDWKVHDNQGVLAGGGDDSRLAFGAPHLASPTRGAPIFSADWKLVGLQQGGRPSDGQGRVLSLGALRASIEDR